MLKVKDFAKIRMGHAFRSRLEHVPYGSVQVIQPKNISADGAISFGPPGPIKTDVSAAKPLKSGDVLVVNRGRFAAAVFDIKEPGTWIVPSSILILSVKSPSVLPEYVACYFNSASGQRLFKRHCEQTTIPFISTGNLECMRIPVPALERQRELVACCKAVARHAYLTSRKQALYRQLLNHEMDSHNQSVERREP